MIALLRQRRSIRKFQDQPIEKDTINILKESLLRAPSSRNLKPCSFVFVYDRDILSKLSLAKLHGASFLKYAPLGIVVLADENVSDVWTEDASIASILVQMTAQAEGLGSCWIQIRNRKHDEKTGSEEYIRELLDLEDNIRVESIIAVGYPDEEKEPIPYNDLMHGSIWEID
jgi:nitroreductase